MNCDIFIPVRLNSARLPKKAIRKIGNDIAILYLIKRLRKVKNARKIVVCTTTLKSDDYLVEFLKKNRISYFRGSNKDILQRFLDAANKFGTDFIVNVDGDDLLADPSTIKKIISLHKKANNEFIKLTNMPLGLQEFGFTTSLLEKICRAKITKNTETGWINFFTATKICKITNLPISVKNKLPHNIRLSLDYAEDLEIFRTVLSELGDDFSLEKLFAYLNKNSKLLEKIKQNDKKWSSHWNENITTYALKKVEPKFLVVGLGSMGNRRIKNLFDLGFHDIIGFDIDVSKRNITKNKFGIKTFSDFNSAISDIPFLILVSTPPDLHYKYVKLAIKNGINCFVEVNMISKDNRQIISDLKQQPVMVFPSCSMLFNPIVKKLKEIIDRNEIGKILKINHILGQHLEYWHPWQNYREYYVSKKITGGAREMVPVELGWLTHVFSPIKNVIGKVGKISNIDANINDHYQGIFTLKNNASMIIDIDVFARPSIRETKIFGNTGSIICDFIKNTIKVSNHGKWKTYDMNFKKTKVNKKYSTNIAEKMYYDEIKSVMNSIKHDDKYPYSINDELDILSVLDNIEDSSRLGKKIIL